MSEPKSVADAARALESTLVRQLLSASGAFKSSPMAGGQLQADLFVETLADAVAKAGGLGLAKMLEKAVGGEEPESKAPPEAPRPSHAPAVAPPTGAVTSGFGERVDPIDGTTKFHTGVDLRAAEGVPIRAAGDGVVRRAGARGGYGNAVEIDHGDGVTTLYGHASALAVKPGDTVHQGETVGFVGATGRATGPHLHFELRVDGRAKDPTPLALKAYGIRVESPTGDRK